MRSEGEAGLRHQEVRRLAHGVDDLQARERHAQPVGRDLLAGHQVLPAPQHQPQGARQRTPLSGRGT